MITIALAALAGQIGCGSSDDQASLNAIGSCGELESHIKDRALAEMNAQIDQILEDWRNAGPYVISPRSGPPLPTATPAPDSQGARDYTRTNTQELDVDEPDFVKNDGSRIFLLHGSQLVWLAAWPPGSTRIVAAARIDGSPIDMFLDGDMLLVYSQVDLQPLYAQLGLAWPPNYFGGGGYGDLPCPFPTANTRFAPCGFADGFKITALRASGSTLSFVAEQWLEGSYVGARRTGSSVRTVSSARLHGPAIQYWPDDLPDSNDWDAVRAAFERLRQKNAAAIRDSQLADWLPLFFERHPGEGLRLSRHACTDCYASSVPLQLGMTTVTLLDSRQPTAAPRRSSLLALSDEVYASRGSLYLATRRYSWGSRGSAALQERTYLHRFETESDTAAARYQGSGSVPGYLADPFSMDEHEGVLRVATTEQQWSRTAASNTVFVLKPHGKRLESIGEVADIARGERLYAARFEGRRGYLVTYRVIDPFFTLDLSDPAHPRLAGELTVPGYSTYLHPLGTDHILAIGRDVTPDGQMMQGLKLAIFDVRDLAHPGLLDSLTVGTASSSSDAEWDYHAFTFFPSRSLLAVPFSDYSMSRPLDPFVTSLELFQASATSGLARFGSIDHSDLVFPEDSGLSRTIRRGVMMDDYVYSISWAGVKVHALGDLSHPLVTILLPEPWPPDAR